MKHDYLCSRLKLLPDIWSADSKSVNLETFESLKSFLSSCNKANLRDHSKTHPGQTPYQQSIFHFFLYYSYYPKIPFVIKTEKSFSIGSFYGREYDSIELSIPSISNALTALNDIEYLLYHHDFGSFIQEEKFFQVLLRDSSEEMVQYMRSSPNRFSFGLSSLRELYYQIYDLNQTLGKRGKKFSNLRWHLNKFHRADHNIEVVYLSENVKPVIHLIGAWKKDAVKKRGFSYVNLRSDKLAARLFGNSTKGSTYSSDEISFSDCLSRVLKVDGRIASFNFGYPLGFLQKENVFAHAVGISDLSIPHLAEYAQYDFWNQIKQHGYSFVNDGPSWRNSLELYKQKFRPIAKNRYYYATLKI